MRDTARLVASHCSFRLEAVVFTEAPEVTAPDERRQSPRPETLLSHPWGCSTLLALASSFRSSSISVAGPGRSAVLQVAPSDSDASRPASRSSR